MRPAFVVTFSAASMAGCAKDVPVVEEARNPPEQPVPTVAPSAEVSAAPVARGEHTVSRNPTTPAGAIRLASNGTCFVYKPFGPLKPGEQRPPGTEPPRETVACPAGFAADPSYKDCIEGVVLAAADGADCVCAVGGNPPPLPRAVVCPK
jgi:hypothetical protein